MKTPEGYEKDDIDKFFKPLIAAGEVWLFKPYMAGFGKSGVSDYVGCHRGHAGQMFSVEVKRPGKEPTPIQNRRMAEIDAAGGKTFWGTAERVIPLFEEWINAKSPQQACQNCACGCGLCRARLVVG